MSFAFLQHIFFSIVNSTQFFRYSEFSNLFYVIQIFTKFALHQISSNRKLIFVRFFSFRRLILNELILRHDDDESWNLFFWQFDLRNSKYNRFNSFIEFDRCHDRANLNREFSSLCINQLNWKIIFVRRFSFFTLSTQIFFNSNWNCDNYFQIKQSIVFRTSTSNLFVSTIFTNSWTSILQNSIWICEKKYLS